MHEYHSMYVKIQCDEAIKSYTLKSFPYCVLVTHTRIHNPYFLSVLMIASITVRLILIFVCTKLLLLMTSLHFLITMKNVKWLTYIFIIIKIMLFIYEEKQLLQVASVFFLVIIVLYYISSIIVIFFRFFINQKLFIVCWHEFKKRK